MDVHGEPPRFGLPHENAAGNDGAVFLLELELVHPERGVNPKSAAVGLGGTLEDVGRVPTDQVVELARLVGPVNQDVLQQLLSMLA
jgi:hypothetical protein